MNTENRKVKRFEIYLYDFGENAGSIQCGRRPVLILQDDRFNENSPTNIVAALTTAIKKEYLPSHHLCRRTFWSEETFYGSARTDTHGQSK